MLSGRPTTSYLGSRQAASRQTSVKSMAACTPIACRHQFANTSRGPFASPRSTLSSASVRGKLLITCPSYQAALWHLERCTLHNRLCCCSALMMGTCCAAARQGLCMRQLQLGIVNCNCSLSRLRAIAQLSVSNHVGRQLQLPCASCHEVLSCLYAMSTKLCQAIYQNGLQIKRKGPAYG